MADSQQPVLFFRVEPLVYQELGTFLLAMDTLLELPKIKSMIHTLEQGTRAVYPEPPKPEPPPKANGKGKPKDKPAGVETAKQEK